LSACLYVPAAIGFVTHPVLGTKLRSAMILLVIGAIGSGTDAILHLVAYAMTQPGVDTQAMMPVMAFLQGPTLLLLAPILLAFFIGGGWLSRALAKAGVVSKRNAQMHWAALVLAVVFGPLVARGLFPGRDLGLTVLGLISFAQAWCGYALMASEIAARS